MNPYHEKTGIILSYPVSLSYNYKNNNNNNNNNEKSIEILSRNLQIFRKEFYQKYSGL